MGRLQNLKDAFNLYKMGEDFSIFTKQELGMARIYNLITTIIHICLFIYFENLALEIFFFMFTLHYCYRAYLLEKYIKFNYTKD